MEQRNTRLRNAGFVTFFFSGICTISSGVVVSLLQEEYGFAYGMTGTLLSLLSIGNLLAGLLAGALVGKMGMKPSILLLTIGYAVGYGLMGLTGLPILLALAFFIVGIAKGSVLNTCTILVSGNSADRTRGMNTMHACYACGALLCPFLISAAARVSTTLAVLALAALGLVLWLVYLFTPMAGRAKAKEAVTDWSFLRSSRFWLLTGLLFCQNAAEQSVVGWMVTYFKDSGIIAGTLAAYTVTVMWGATLIGRLLIAFVFPLKQPRKAMVFMAVFCTAFYFAMMQTHSQLPAILLLFAFAFSMAGMNPTAVASAGKMTTVTSMGIMLPVASSGAILMPWAIGKVAESAGLAVGMATSIPPHNFGEVIDGVKAYMKNPDITTEEMMKYIKGPDFPTGGIVTNQDELLSIYETGIGKIKVRGKVEIEAVKGGKERLIITEIPYTMIGANIGKFLNDVYSLVETKKTNDIVDISNQSSKEGIRIVIELRKGADAQNLCNLLYKKTKLEDTFGVNMLAVADGRPETLGLVPIIRHHVKFQYELATRKYKTLLAKELDKKEIQEGLIRACDVIDLIIEILRGSRNIKDAKNCLMNGVTENIKFKTKESEKKASKLNFTERQATAILEMRLYKLIGLEVEALMDEHNTTLKNIAEYEDILTNRSTMAKVIMKELDGLKKNYSRERRTRIDNVEAAVYEEKKMEEMEVVFLMDRFGYAKTIDVAAYERNKEAADSENRYVLHCMNTGKICIFTNTGQMHLLKVVDLPFGKFRDKGQPIDNVSNYDSSKEQLIYITDLAALCTQKLLFGTKTAMLKQVDGKEFDVAKRTTAATKLADDDAVIFVAPVEENMTIVMQSAKDMFLRIAADTIPEKKKGAIGVCGMKLAAGDELTNIYALGEEEPPVVMVKDKEIALNRLHIGNRATKGVKK